MKYGFEEAKLGSILARVVARIDMDVSGILFPEFLSRDIYRKLFLFDTETSVSQKLSGILLYVPTGFFSKIINANYQQL